MTSARESSTRESSTLDSSTKESNKKGKQDIVNKYSKYTQLEHILFRPDTYVGDVKRGPQLEWVIDSDKLVHRNILKSPAEFKIFDELMVNSLDNIYRDPNCKTIKICVDKSENSITVWNDGDGIEVEKHPEYNIWVIELIFGHLLTSSNYNDKEERLVGGRNGYGAKLTNIFSKQFTVTVVNQQSRKKYTQTWSKNMTEKSEPTITEIKSKAKKIDSYTEIKYYPDLERFGETHITDEMVMLLHKRAYDAAALRKAKVYFNDMEIPFNNKKQYDNFKQYVSMYCSSMNAKEPVFEKENERWQVGVSHIPGGEFQKVSYVNGICTPKGGTHVSYILDKIVKQLLVDAKKELKKKYNITSNIKPNIIKEQLCIFVNATIVNPTFNSQTKDELTTKPSAFGSSVELTETFIKKIIGLGIFEQILLSAQMKEISSMKKMNGSKKQKLRIDKLDDAIDAGTRRGKECTIIVTEGDSAKTFAVSGLSVLGRKTFGVFPLKGKPINVLQASIDQIKKNEELNNLIQIIGLQYGKEYDENEVQKSLRYGKLLVLADQDVDGTHIKGLILNMFNHFWPSLLRLDFVQTLNTPIIKAVKSKTTKVFYDESDYHKWKETIDINQWKIKYYKGLGTSTSQEARETFKDYHDKVINYIKSPDEESSKTNSIDKAFNGKRAGDRKKWLIDFDPKKTVDSTYIDDGNKKREDIDKFVDNELILFSISDNKRSLPSIIDGFKPSQRKVVFGSFSKGLDKKDVEVKVAQLAGYVSDRVCYHHGEMSLNQVIINLAQNFIGNNINILDPLGQFGTRLKGGKDAASPRYIWTKLSKLMTKIFLKVDNSILNHLEDDGIMVEPEWYAPIIPMLLVNGAKGIGTGFSTEIPSFNPLDLIENIRLKMDSKPMKNLKPWYRNFTGTIVKKPKGVYETRGCYTLDKKTNTVIITELPIGMWTDDALKFLNDLESNGKILNCTNHSTETKVTIHVEFSKESFDKLDNQKIVKELKLSKNINTNNMHAFSHQGKITHYQNSKDILEEFYHVRLDCYDKRKKHQLNQMNEMMILLDARIRFIEAKLNKTLVIDNVEEKLIIEHMMELNLPQLKMNKSNESYDYLLEMSQRSTTKEKIIELRKKYEKHKIEMETLEKTSLIDLWKHDLEEFEIEYHKFIQECKN